MKNYNLDDIKKYFKDKYNKDIDIEGYSKGSTDIVEPNVDFIDSNKFSQDVIDSAKTRIIKYITYKKRTEFEVRNKFKNIYDEDLLDIILERFKILGYIDDNIYIKKIMNDFFNLNHLSMFEIKHKLTAKGLKTKDIDDYFLQNNEKLIEYEKESARYYVNKKRNSMDEIEIKQFLYKKGYKSESIKSAFEE